MIFYLDIKQQLDHIERLTKASHIKIMSTITDFKNQLADYHATISDTITKISEGVAALKKRLEERPTEGLTPEEQAAILAKVGEISDKLKALEEQTEEPPTVPSGL